MASPQKTPDKSSKLNNLICHLPVPSRTTHESISIQPAVGQHNLLHTFRNQCWKINHCSQHDNTVANSILVEHPQKHLFPQICDLDFPGYFPFCVWSYIWTLLDIAIVLPTIVKKKRKKDGGSKLCWMIIWSEGPTHGNVSLDRHVSALRPSERSWERDPSRVKVPETAAITVLGKGMTVDRWRDTNRKRRWSSVCQTLQICFQTLTALRQKK